MTAMVITSDTRFGLPVVDSVEHVYSEFSDDLIPESNFASHHGPELRRALTRLLQTRLVDAWARRGYPGVRFLSGVEYARALSSTNGYAARVDGAMIVPAFEQLSVWREVVDAIDWDDVLTAAGLHGEYHGYVRSRDDFSY